MFAVPTLAPSTLTLLSMSAQRRSTRSADLSVSAMSTPTCAARPQESSSVSLVPASAPLVCSLKKVV